MVKFFRNLLSARASLDAADTNGLLVEIDEGTRKKLQGVFLEMFQDVQKFCRDHGLQVFLIGGSALGAVRHQGFIPWDDDLDIAMSRADYNCFTDIFEKEFGSKYELNAPNCKEPSICRFTKIYKRGTLFREDTDTSPEGHGIFLDLFAIENIPRNAFRRKIRGLCCNALQFLSSQVCLYENRNPALKAMYSQTGKANYRIRMVIGFLFSFWSSAKWFNYVDRLAQYPYTGLFGIVTGRKHYFGEIFEEKILFPERKVDFCGLNAYVFNQVELYLENLYGNYMEIPPEEKREKHYIVEMHF